MWSTPMLQHNIQWGKERGMCLRASETSTGEMTFWRGGGVWIFKTELQLISSLLASLESRPFPHSFDTLYLQTYFKSCNVMGIVNGIPRSGPIHWMCADWLLQMSLSYVALTTLLHVTSWLCVSPLCSTPFFPDLCSLWRSPLFPKKMAYNIA